MQGKGQRSCLEVVYFPAFSQDSGTLFGSTPLPSPPPAHLPPAHLTSYCSRVWLRQPSTFLWAKQQIGAPCKPISAAKARACRVPPKMYLDAGTSLCRSLWRGTSNPPKAIGLYNLLCTRLWLGKKAFFFFFFWVLLARLLKCEQSWTEQTSCREKIIGVFFVSMTGFPSPAIWFFFFKYFFLGGLFDLIKVRILICSGWLPCLSYLLISKTPSHANNLILRRKKNESKQSLSPTNSDA